jgi:Na+/H+-translocating membrane pyrophosphatase
VAELAALDQVGENICDVSGACADLFESMAGP